MSILYHDNTTGVQYINEHLADNWDATIEYPDNAYVDVHFRTHCPSYRQGMGIGFKSDIENKAFSNDMAEVLISLGWSVNKIDNDCYGTDATKGKSHLYVHPDDLSGSVLKNEVRTIAEALRENKTFSLRWVDLYETVYDITDDEYKAYIEGKRKEIYGLVLNSAKTTRTNLYKYTNDVLYYVARKIRLKRIGITDSCGRMFDKVEQETILGMITELIDRGYLVRHDTSDGYMCIRTINKTEQRQRKLPIEGVA